MTATDDMANNPPGVPPKPPSEPLGPPQVDMMASREMQAWVARLEAERKTLGVRNKYLTITLTLGILLLAVILWAVYSSTIRAYAVLDDVLITRHPANQGRLEISFRVVRPGKVYYRRTSGNVQTEVVDHFQSTGAVSRSWSWVYEPGEEIDVTLRSRGGLLRRTERKRFPTADRADVVIIIDSTGSMTRFIDELKEKCVAYSEQLKKQALRHRFALIGFGDVQEAPWLDVHEFTDRVAEFQQGVSEIERFDGGDFPESALDALEEALALPFDPKAIRRFYLVTDAEYHEPTRSGLNAAEVVARLDQERVLLQVFSRSQYESKYRELIGSSGRFQEIENFGRVFGEGRVLED
ncbi:MAG: VWA domain-containing protein [Planctomycetes bacterium]|nr:VWA domain-containing protein [Planctomycetota bacterium]